MGRLARRGGGGQRVARVGESRAGNGHTVEIGVVSLRGWCVRRGVRKGVPMGGLAGLDNSGPRLIGGPVNGEGAVCHVSVVRGGGSGR